MASFLKDVSRDNLQKVASSFYDEYSRTTPKRIKAIDAFLVYLMATGVAQFVYVMLVGQFPFNAFLSGFLSAVGMFVLTVALRMQVATPEQFYNVSEERAYADYVVCNVVLHFAVMTFIG